MEKINLGTVNYSQVCKYFEGCDCDCVTISTSTQDISLGRRLHCATPVTLDILNRMLITGALRRMK